MISFKGKHRAIINLFINKFVDDINFNKESKFERCLINASAIKASNKIELYGKKVIETELEYINKNSDIKVSYEEFIMMDEPYVALWEKYPGFVELVRQLFLDLSFNFKMVRKCYSESYDDLVGFNFINSDDDIDDIFYLNGESHDGNRNVVVFYKNKKPSFCLKLRNMSLEKSVSLFIGKFAKEILNIDDWVSAEYLDKKDYGWVKWVERINFKSLEKIERYYYNFGVLLSVSSVLNITDLHYENIISNYNPVVIDLETAFHCNEQNDKKPRVICTHLLPHTLKYSSGIVSIEHSGIGNIFESQQYEDKIVRGNTVEYLGEMKSSLDFIKEIKQGFLDSYWKIKSNKKCFSEILNKVETYTHRILFNSTEIYYSYLSSSMHPDLLRSPEKRREYIRECLLTDRSYHGDESVLEYEIDSIMNGDVPRFTCEVNGTLIFYKDNVISKLNGNIDNGYSYVKSLIDDLSQEFIRRESSDLTGILEQCRDIISINKFESKSNIDFNSLESIQKKLKCKMINYLKRIAKKDSTLKLYIAFNENALEYREPPLDVFNGIAGILYLNSKFNIIDDNIIKDIHDIYLEFIKNIEEDEAFYLGGAYIGYLSCLMPLMLSYNKLSIEAKEILNTSTERIVNLLFDGKDKHPGGCSLLGGISGLMVMSSLYYITSGDLHWKNISKYFFKKLLSLSIKKDNSLIFPYEHKSKHHLKCLSGLSHGQAGIAYAFALYGLIFPEYHSECSMIVEEIINFEIENYDPNLMNWRDFRLEIFNEEAIHDFSWAHGGAGILYCMSFILNHYKIKSLNDFYSSLNLNKIFLDNINGRKHIKNYTISNGHVGAILIFRRLNRNIEVSLESILKEQCYRFNILTGLGIFKGISGEYLALMELSDVTYKQIFPMLPHELFSLFCDR
ncbi:DUF4135 domain-containing protein [Salmonella enterica subsp. enterica]|nr:DUF4135 domain-containing protein [Salmonella enterica subsp. enterica]